MNVPVVSKDGSCKETGIMVSTKAWVSTKEYLSLWWHGADKLLEEVVRSIILVYTLPYKVNIRIELSSVSKAHSGLSSS